MIQHWSIKEIKSQIDQISFAESDPRMDGFVTWGCKKDLYKILWYVEDKLSKCSTYAGEKEFLEEQRSNKIIDKLRKNG